MEFFTKSTKAPYMKFVDFTEEQVAAISSIPGSGGTLNEVAPWSEGDTTLLLRAWAETRVETENTTPSAVEVALKYKELTSGTDKQVVDRVICLKHYSIHNMHRIISAFNAKFDQPSEKRSGPSYKSKWLSLKDDERRAHFASVNTKMAYSYVSLTEKHIMFIADTTKHDDVAFTRTRTLEWTSEHTTAMLYALKQAIAEKQVIAGHHLNKPAMSAVYKCFVRVSGVIAGGKKTFNSRFSSLHFMHSIIAAYTKPNTRESAGDATSGRGESSSEGRSRHGGSGDAAVDAWFDLSLADRRKNFEDADREEYVYTDLSREQFDIFARIVADRAAPTPVGIIRPAAAAELRDSAESDNVVPGGTRRDKRMSQPRVVASVQQLPSAAPTRPSPPTTSLISTARAATNESTRNTVGGNEEAEIVHVSQQSSTALERISRSAYVRNESTIARPAIGHSSHVESSAGGVSDESSATSSQVPDSQVDDGGSSTESEVDDWCDTVPSSPPNESASGNADEGATANTRSDSPSSAPGRKRSRSSTQELQLHKQQHEKSFTANLPQTDALEKRVRVVGPFADAASALQKQIEVLKQMLVDAREASALDQAEREQTMEKLSRDRRAWRESLRALNDRLDELRREQMQWRAERDEIRRSWTDLRE